MPRKRSWTDIDLTIAVKNSKSVRSVIKKLGLIPAGGNYRQVQDAIESLNLDVSHFTGKGWNEGWKFDPRVKLSLEEILVKGRRHQGHALKKRLYVAGLKKPECEMCGWAEQAIDGRIPVELDHINGDHYDNRLANFKNIVSKLS